MAIRKSRSLHDWLLTLNFVILTWELNIGDWIEVAVDWCIDWINEAYQLGERALSWAQGAWDYALSLFDYALSTISRLRSDFENWVDTTVSSINTWWAARANQVQDWIATARDALKVSIDTLRFTVNYLDTAWGSFWRDTLPDLVNFSWFRSWWGHATTTFDNWWSAAWRQVQDETEARIQPVRDEVNRHTSWLDSVKELFEDPEQWLLDRLASMLARFL